MRRSPSDSYNKLGSNDCKSPRPSPSNNRHVRPIAAACWRYSRGWKGAMTNTDGLLLMSIQMLQVTSGSTKILLPNKKPNCSEAINSGICFFSWGNKTCSKTPYRNYRAIVCRIRMQAMLISGCDTTNLPRRWKNGCTSYLPKQGCQWATHNFLKTLGLIS